MSGLVLPHLVLLGGLLSSTANGALLYAWSVFVKPLQAEFGWSRADLAFAFSLGVFVLSFASLISGRLMGRLSPRLLVALGALLMGAGFAAAGFTSSRGWLYLFYSGVACFGGGLMYIPPIALAPRWWPHRRVMATGVVVMGLGLGSFLMAPLATWMIENPSLGWRYVFWVVGSLMGLFGLISSALMVSPPVGYVPSGVKLPPVDPSRGLSHGETVRRPLFWALYLAFFCGAFGGLMCLSFIAAVGREAGLPPMVAAMAVSVYGVSNALSRPLVGMLADRIGLKRAFLSTFGPQVLCMASFPHLASSAPLFLLISLLLGWNFGSMFSLFPGSTAYFFGLRAQAANYGLLFTAFGVAGLFGPYFGGRTADLMGSYSYSFYGASLVVLLGLVLLTFIFWRGREVTN